MGYSMKISLYGDVVEVGSSHLKAHTGLLKRRYSTSKLIMVLDLVLIKTRVGGIGFEVLVCQIKSKTYLESLLWHTIKKSKLFCRKIAHNPWCRLCNGAGKGKKMFEFYRCLE